MPPGLRPLICAIVALGAAVPGVSLPALAQDAAVGSFSDVQVQHWAFTTVELLARKYKVMAGFPEGTFRGDAEVSRYELSAALTKVMERMESMTGAKKPVPPADVAVVMDVASMLKIAALKARADKLEADIKAQQAQAPGGALLSGRVGLTGIDNVQDTQAPYESSSLSLSIKAGTPETGEFFGSMSGSLPAANTGLKPSSALPPGATAKPGNDAWKVSGAAYTSHPLGADVRMGLFKPSALFGGGSALDDHWGDGIVGNGALDPGIGSVRWSDRAVALAARKQFGGLKVAAGVTPLVLLAGLDYTFNEFIRLKLSADTDQPDWTNLFGSNRASAHNLLGTVDLGTPALGLSIQTGLAKDLLQASGELLWKPWGDIQLGLGAVYTTANDGNVTEVTPGVFVYFPAYARWTPSLQLGAKEPEIVATDHGNTGPGSLLGSLAGVSVVANWKLEDLGVPNVTFEYNIQQPVLFYQTYDATFAVSIGRDF